VSKRFGESGCQKHLADQELFQLLEKVDADLVEEARSKGCRLCGGKLHRSDCDRKPRDGPQWDRRFSLCCAKEDCRRRQTPPSVRFLGQRVNAGLVVVLVSAMLHAPRWDRHLVRVISPRSRNAACRGPGDLLPDHDYSAESFRRTQGAKVSTAMGFLYYQESSRNVNHAVECVFPPKSLTMILAL
jgi:hypothetical protein